jgi:hypothetical protein
MAVLACEDWIPDGINVSDWLYTNSSLGKRQEECLLMLGKEQASLSISRLPFLTPTTTTTRRDPAAQRCTFPISAMCE